MQVAVKKAVKVRTLVRRVEGQVLNCEYGHHWPLNQFTKGFVKLVSIANGTALSYVWAETREALK